MRKPKIRAAVCDLNGVWRGKLMPFSKLGSIEKGTMRMPYSLPAVDIWGHDIVDGALVYETGDADGLCLPTGRGPLTEKWLSSPSVFVPVWMTDESGAASMVDPRQILAKVVAELESMNLFPVVALEMEFYLTDPAGDQPKSPMSPLTGEQLSGDSILSLQDMDHFDAFFADLYAACADYDIPADAAISEGGAGQFEINLLHIDDVLRAADNAQLFKRIVKGIARKHKLAASFMAKPYIDRAGSGMHVHFSMLDKSGKNVFDNGGEDGSDLMLNAVAGLLEHMAASTLIFAPHRNSYRRLQPNMHAPTGIGWGYENRTAAIRIPGGEPAARRIEHRVSGADANPYLLLAAILAAALAGIKGKMTPAEPLDGNAYEADLKQLPDDWAQSIKTFEQSTFAADCLDSQFKSTFVALKLQELGVFTDRMSGFEVGTYLETV